ncbi:hypothetical protein AWH56_018915 [Anaerobacillus isosaccharinicus]|uniref:Uncharacterized protein n=1 Tax=Anaerobacillus isosaccharinicus TaxID=1532552 RepID=A0A1S2M7L3_9BACI|nr:hypothetical protein [Anaerobacillus isosaccharinicus]QOY34778.1 hypothetical protein AWH56_018915 [Anaerobacillus isosaccharinicus]
MQGDCIENQEIISNIKEINKRLCNEIWNVVSSEQTIQGLSPRLILPSINDVARISEQEARVLCTSILNSTSYYYSIETPTENSYQFTGNYALKTRSDLSIYEIDMGNTFNKIVNVEFKAHNPEASNIKKDIEKLIREDVVGNWFHLFKNMDSGTFSSVFNKFIQAINDNKQYVNKTISIVFCFCVVEKKIALQKHFYFTPNINIDLDEYSRQFFKQNNLDGNSSSNEENGWELIRT